jgi:hypothetical protein
MSGEKRGFFAVDRFEGEYVVLIGDDETAYDVKRAELPASLREGSVLSVKQNEEGQLLWSDARLDVTEYQRRLENTRQQLRELKKRDPGGDITL